MMKKFVLCVDILAYDKNDDLLFVPDLIFFSDSLNSLLELNGAEFFSITCDYVKEKYSEEISIFDFTYECSFGDVNDISIKEFLKDCESCNSVMCFER